MAELKVRVTLGDTTVEGMLDELLESGTFKMEYDQAELDEIVKEKVEGQRAAWEADPKAHLHQMTEKDMGAHTFSLPGLCKYEIPCTVHVASGCFASRPKNGDGLTGWMPVLLYTLKKKEDADA